MMVCNNKVSCVVEHEIGEKYNYHCYLYRTEKHVIAKLGTAGMKKIAW